jgi:hypothetical protein
MYKTIVSFSVLSGKGGAENSLQQQDFTPVWSRRFFV